MTQVVRPTVTTRDFKNLDAALDFLKFVQPESVAIDRKYQTHGNVSEIIGYRVQYTGSEGMTL